MYPADSGSSYTETSPLEDRPDKLRTSSQSHSAIPQLNLGEGPCIAGTSKQKSTNQNMIVVFLHQETKLITVCPSKITFLDTTKSNRTNGSLSSTGQPERFVTTSIVSDLPLQCTPGECSVNVHLSDCTWPFLLSLPLPAGTCITFATQILILIFAARYHRFHHSYIFPNSELLVIPIIIEL